MASGGVILGFLAVLAATVIVGLAAKRNVRQSSDFVNAGGRLGWEMVAGALVGGFVGGTSIVGTSELAFRHGLSALWFTLGGGLSIMLLGVFAGRFRQLRVETLPALVGSEYGQRARFGASLFLCAGMFIQVIAQVIAALPLLSVFWHGEIRWLALVPAVLILAYILLGGFFGASMVGTLKTALLALLLFGAGVWLTLRLPAAEYLRWESEGRLSLFGGGAASSWAQGGAMVIGIFSTQAYLQPIFAGRTTRSARIGAFAAGSVIIAIGVMAAWIGMFMRDTHPHIEAREAISQFFFLYAPPWLTGGALAVILLSVVMTGAALALSIGTVLNQDVIQRVTRRFAGDEASLRLSRLLIVAVMLLAYAIVCSNANSLILEWAFLSMTLRGVTLFFPVLFFLLRIGPIERRWAEWSVWGGPLVALGWAWLGLKPTGIDPLYLGGLWSLLTLVLGRRAASARNANDPSPRPLG